MLKIAMTCSGEADKHFLHERYTRVLLKCAKEAGISGVMPVILPIAEDKEVIRSYAECFDGFLITGGVDINPQIYGEEVLPECGSIDDKRDEFELAFMSAIIGTGKPVFGICRGIQIMNVALGGTLWQDIHSQCCGEGKLHCVKDENGATHHRVHISGCLRDLVGQDEITTNSYHHQSVKKLGDGLSAVGFSDEGIVEAIVHESLPFYRGVQWHPEIRPDGISQKLFESFLNAVQNFVKS